VAVLTGIELCSGVGMLGEGVRAAFRFLGHEYRTVAYVEREAAAASQLVTLMEAGIIDPSPVWSDMLTFDGAAWRGRVDCIIAGFPCQDLSIAGRRAGLDGKRSGLFFRVCDIADDCAARFLILENVSAIASATASVVDEAEGELEERAASRVMGELADRGWDAEWITLSASEVGASHRRARWFCFAWRMADADGAGRRISREHQCRNGHAVPRINDVSDPISPRLQERTGGGAATMSHFNRPSGPTLSAFVTHSESSPQARIAATGPESSSNSPSSPRRLNPAFAAWLMGIPWWWTNPAVTSSAQSEMASYRSKLDAHLSRFFDAPESGLNKEVA